MTMDERFARFTATERLGANLAALLGAVGVFLAAVGVYAVLAHLRRGSLRVRKGQSVRAGDVLAECGNSGNSTEPHLHFQLMDHPNPVFAAGLPVSFEEFTVGGQTGSGVPSKEHAFEVA